MNGEGCTGENSFIRKQNLDARWRTRDNAPPIHPKIPIKVPGIDAKVKFYRFPTIFAGERLRTTYHKAINRIDIIILEVIPVARKAAGKEHCFFRGYCWLTPGEEDEPLWWNSLLFDTPARFIVEEA